MTTSIFQGDCLDLLSAIPTGSIDLIVCDLPYGTTACRWDSVIPFEPLWTQYNRVAKTNAAMIFTACQPFTTALIASNLKAFRYCWVWEKEQGVNFLNAKHQPMKVHEDICVFFRETATYNPQMTPGVPYVSGAGDSGEVSGKVPKTRSVNSGVRYPRSVQRIQRETGLHPTQKPVALMEYLIATYSNPGETVLDNCMGSGTTGVAAKRLGRAFVGMEMDPDHYATAVARIGKA